MSGSPVSMAQDDVQRLAVEEVLDAVAAPQASSGAGVAAALALALGVACARKAIGISLKRDIAAGLEGVDEHLRIHQHRAVAHAQRDALLFEAYLAARRPLEAQHLVESAQHFQQLVADVGSELDALRDRVATVVEGDLVAARALHQAAAEVAADLLRQARGERNRIDS